MDLSASFDTEDVVNIYSFVYQVSKTPGTDKDKTI